ncbi:protein of unknown function [Desulforhopalus singaporensis]|uniref:DnaJ homologue subfamily C member 28 conserved domain-containing protein n=2 Tax=Desulforhopalus singaporensis TaxID=91360 RepID=A0A1H0LYN3_9BACT|nr:protein of unknown function [Desulforhopalus singaporensis]
MSGTDRGHIPLAAATAKQLIRVTGVPMESIAFIAEQKIVQAMKERDLTASKWKNKPLPLDDDRLVPDDLKMAYKLLKNSGYLPPEIEERKEVQKLEDLIAATEDEHERVRQMKKLNVLLMKVEARRSFTSNIASQQDYYQKVVERISVKSKVPGK